MPDPKPLKTDAPVHLEVEVKAHLPDLVGWDEKLRALGSFAGEELQEDVYFGPADVPSEQTDAFRHKVFRLRSSGGSHRVTLKKKRISDGVEESREVEFPVGSAEGFREFAAGLGFRPFVEKRKRVRDYRVEGLSVLLVDVEGLGHFIEIEHLGSEGESPEVGRRHVLDLLRRLQVPEDAIEPRLYIDLLRNR